MDSTNPQTATQQQPPPQPQPTQTHQRPQLHPQQGAQVPQPPFNPQQYHHHQQQPRPTYPLHSAASIYQPPYPQYYHAPPYTQQWPQPHHWVAPPPHQNPATYAGQPAQPQLANMVTQQPQPNVPQQQQTHHKSSHMTGSTIISTDQRQLNPSPQSVTEPNSSQSNKGRKMAILRHPETREVISLVKPENPTTTKSTPPVTQSTPTITKDVEVTTTFLRNVIDDGENKENAELTKPDKANLQTKEQKQQQTNQLSPKNPTSQPTQSPQNQTSQQQQNDKVNNEKALKNTEQIKDNEFKSVETPSNDKETFIIKKDDDKTIKNVKEQDPNQTVVDTTYPDATSTTPTNTTAETTADKKLEESQNGDESGKSDEEVKKENVDGEEGKEESNPLESLTYEPTQYNPISNRQGRRVYSRQFLLDVCELIVKADPLQRDSDDKMRMEPNQPFGLERIDPFAPQYNSSSQRFVNRQNDPSRRQSQQNYAGRSSAGQERQRKVITSVSLTQEVELKTTSNPWRPTKDIKEVAATDEVETESLKKKFRSILNKLTPNNFDSLAESVTKLNIDTESKLGDVIDIVFAKALSEPGYCVLYGQMCSHLKKVSAGQANFGNTLIKRCQHQFQSDIYSGLNMKERKEKIDAEEDATIRKQLEEELYEEMYRCRMRGLGLIKFIGELYKIEMLNDTIMLDCVVRLLLEPSEESLECLCDLLATIGEKLDRSTSQKNIEKEKKAPKSASKTNAYGAGQKSLAAVLASGPTQPKSAEQPTGWSLDKVFEELSKIRKNKELNLSVRIRFKLLDTIELREKDNWQSKKTKDNNPKKIDEIREAHKEKLEQERKQNAMGPRRSQEGRRLGHSGGSSSQISSLAMESGGYRGQSNMHTSASSHLIRDHSIGDNMKSNHDDLKSQEEHQKKLESLKNMTFLKNQLNKPALTNESLRPNSQIYTSKRI